MANDVFLDWYSGTPPYKVTPLQGIINACGKNVKITYAGENRIDKAVNAAKSADIAIVLVGNHPIGATGEWNISPVPSDGKEAVDVMNTGKYTADEVVQPYVRYLDSSVERPFKQLKGFIRVPVNVGETRNITITLKGEDLAYWNERGHAFKVEPGKIE